MSMKKLVFLFLVLPIILWAQPENDLPCDASTLLPCQSINGTTVDANYDVKFVHSGICDVSDYLSVYYDFQPNASSPYLDIVLESPGNNGDISLLFGKWLTDCDSLFISLGEYCGPISEAQLAIIGVEENVQYTLVIASPPDNPVDFNISACENSISSCLENDLCIDAIDLGIISADYNACVTGCNLGVMDSESLGNCEHEGVVWYTFKSGSSFDYDQINLQVTSYNDIVPVYRLYKGSCSNLEAVIPCKYGNYYGSSVIEVEFNTSYYIGISSFFVESPEFEICLTAHQSGSACVTSIHLEPVSTSFGSPLYGPYEACEEVEFCITIDEFNASFNQTGCQWLQGIIPVFGVGWDREASLDSTGKPILSTAFEDIQEYDGIWGWYNDITYNNTVTSKTVGDFDDNGILDMCHYTESDCSNEGISSGTIMPPGWFSYNLLDPDDTDGHPNFDWGDGNGCSILPGPWNICFTLKATCDTECPDEDCLDASVKIYTTSDGETGNWFGGNSICKQDEPSILKTEIIPSITITNELQVETGNNYMRINNENEEIANSLWQLEGSEIFRTTASTIHLIGNPDQEQQLKLFLSSNIQVDSTAEDITNDYYPEPVIEVQQDSICMYDTVKILNTTNEALLAATWSISNASIIEETDSMILVQFMEGGQQDIQLYVTDFHGNQASRVFQQDFYIFPDPTVSFSYEIENTNILLNSFVEYSNYFEWRLDGEVFATNEENPSINIPENGTYLLTIQAYNDCSVVEYSETIDFFVYPESRIQLSSSNLCMDTPIQFLQESNQILDSIRWHFPGGIPETSDEQSIDVTFSQTGNKTVYLYSYNPFGTHLDSLVFNIEANPLAQFEYEILDNQIILDNQSSSFTEFEWLIIHGSDTLTQSENSFELNKNGSYTIFLIVENVCSVDSTSETFTIDIFPEVAFISTDEQICKDQEIELFIETNPLLDSIRWTYDNGGIDVGLDYSKVVSFDENGHFPIVVEVFNMFGIDTDTIWIDVFETGIASFDFTLDKSNLSLENTSSNVLNYYWSIDQLPDTISSYHPTIQLPKNGSYLVELIISNPCNMDTAHTTIEIDGYSTPLIAASEQIICSGKSIQFIDETETLVDSRLWYFEGGSPDESTEDTVFVYYENPGFFDVRLTTVNDYGSSILEQLEYIEVKQTPEVAFEYDQNTSTFTSLTNGGDEYYWEFGDGMTSDEEHPIHFYESDGTYTVRLTVNNAFCEQSYETEIDVIIVSTYKEPSSSIQVVPNPIENELRLEYFDLTPGLYSIEIFNSKGLSLINRDLQLKNTSGSIIIDEPFSSGMYYLLIHGQEKQYFLRFIRI